MSPVPIPAGLRRAGALALALAAALHPKKK